MKICKKCNIEQDYCEYYRHSQMEDGYLSTCKTCKRKQQLEIRQNNSEHYKNYDRNRPNKVERAKKAVEYQQTEKGKEVKQKCTTNYKTNYPIKYKATNAVNNAVRDGKLVKPSECEYCKNTFTSRLLHGHHSD